MGRESIGKENQLKIRVEALSKEFYDLRLLNAQLVEEVKGAKLEGNRLLIQVPSGLEEEFVEEEIVLKIKDHQKQG